MKNMITTITLAICTVVVTGVYIWERLSGVDSSGGMVPSEIPMNEVIDITKQPTSSSFEYHPEVRDFARTLHDVFINNPEKLEIIHDGLLIAIEGTKLWYWSNKSSGSGLYRPLSLKYNSYEKKLLKDVFEYMDDTHNRQLNKELNKELNKLNK